MQDLPTLWFPNKTIFILVFPDIVLTELFMLFKIYPIYWLKFIHFYIINHMEIWTIRQFAGIHVLLDANCMINVPFLVTRSPRYPSWWFCLAFRRLSTSYSTKYLLNWVSCGDRWSGYTLLFVLSCRKCGLGFKILHLWFFQRSPPSYYCLQKEHIRMWVRKSKFQDSKHQLSHRKSRPSQSPVARNLMSRKKSAFY